MLFAGERGGDSIVIGECAIGMVTIANISTTATVRYRYFPHIASPVTSYVDLCTGAPVHPAISGPTASGRIFVYYVNVSGALAMKWSNDLGKIWYDG